MAADAPGGAELNRPGLRVHLGRLAYRAAYLGLRLWWFTCRPQTRGVKLLLRRGDELLFVRHSYGPAVWEIPGGGRRRGESPAQAAARELREEVGVDVREWTCVGDFVVTQRATAHLTCLVGEDPGGPLALARAEIVEARWARVERPPEPLSPYARAALDVLARFG